MTKCNSPVPATNAIPHDSAAINKRFAERQAANRPWDGHKIFPRDPQCPPPAPHVPGEPWPLDPGLPDSALTDKSLLTRLGIEPPKGSLSWYQRELNDPANYVSEDAAKGECSNWESKQSESGARHTKTG